MRVRRFEEDDDESRSNDKFGIFTMPKNINLGPTLLKKEQFKDAIRTYVVHSWRNSKFLKMITKELGLNVMGYK